MRKKAIESGLGSSSSKVVRDVWGARGRKRAASSDVMTEPTRQSPRLLATQAEYRQQAEDRQLEAQNSSQDEVLERQHEVLERQHEVLEGQHEVLSVLERQHGAQTRSQHEEMLERLLEIELLGEIDEGDEGSNTMTIVESVIKEMMELAVSEGGDVIKEAGVRCNVSRSCLTAGAT